MLEHRRDRALQHHRRHREDEDREQYRQVEQRLASEGEEPEEPLAIEPAVMDSAGPEQLAIGGQALGAISGGVIGLRARVRVPLERESAADRVECGGGAGVVHRVRRSGPRRS